VDDGSRDGIREIVERAADPRVRLIRSEGAGAAAARNRALDSARGDVVAYLDDDNVMAPLWLHGVAWAFQVHPERTLLFGAQAVQDECPQTGGGPLDRRLWIRFDPWDRGRLEHGNYIDLGAVAHRRRLPEARFDERIVQIEDWDLLLRLTRDSAPLELPLLSGTYRSDAPGRVTQLLDSGPSYDLVRAKLEADRRR
jgi:glycosyltransferase involved in cell wall biosynthesis